jgi:DNA-binding response OmpR family regulator
MDVDLPDMDGFDVCSYLRSEYEDVPMIIIMMSEPGDDLTRTSFGRMVDFVGGDFFFAKPCDARLVVKLVNELVAETPRRSTPIAAAVFPTRAAWPTAR